MIRTQKHLVCKRTLDYLAKLVKWLSCVVSTYLYGAFDCIIMSRTSFRVNPHSIVCLNVKGLLARSRRNIWSISDSNVIWTHNHLVRKRTLKHLVKPVRLAKWFSVRLRTKWLWVRIVLLLLKINIWCLLWARSSLKLVRDKIIKLHF